MKKILFPILILVLTSLEVSSIPPRKEAMMFDHFENINCEEEKARLDNFANQLRDHPDSVGTSFSMAVSDMVVRIEQPYHVGTRERPGSRV